jgi:hypothetical protein
VTIFWCAMARLHPGPGFARVMESSRRARHPPRAWALVEGGVLRIRDRLAARQITVAVPSTIQNFRLKST